jgi:hypothetical protein
MHRWRIGRGWPLGTSRWAFRRGRRTAGQRGRCRRHGRRQTSTHHPDAVIRPATHYEEYRIITAECTVGQLVEASRGRWPIRDTKGTIAGERGGFARRGDDRTQLLRVVVCDVKHRAVTAEGEAVRPVEGSKGRCAVGTARRSRAAERAHEPGARHDLPDAIAMEIAHVQRPAVGRERRTGRVVEERFRAHAVHAASHA